MAKHLIMDHTGHSTIEFDRANQAERDAAMARFAALVGEQKHLAATRSAGETDYAVIRRFEDERDETLFKPHNVGG